MSKDGGMRESADALVTKTGAREADQLLQAARNDHNGARYAYARAEKVLASAQQTLAEKKGDLDRAAEQLRIAEERVNAANEGA